jgi:hypothetical protein
MHAPPPSRRALGLAAALALLACAGAAPRPSRAAAAASAASPPAPSPAGRVQPLDDGGSPLRDRFDADRAQPRLLVLASPT